ncbi:hypothetical protein [Roseospira visakhapatnamensis]|uniref:ATP-binding protein n=1 Tax=Roseospira visakhapatnamensis TaxID=390880 RepID=A0A7W6WC53_9PROT|nr:hypothetical protein [Roseospira visakhapatnamensis]MBB4268247.1 hypothetical protein [Roseospira visakhapatnamensis]
MTDRQPIVNATTAPLTNVLRFGALVDACVQRPRHLPGIGVFYGHSGFGKTWSAVHAAHRTRARYVECGESWTKLRFLRALAEELGVSQRGTGPDLVERIIIAVCRVWPRGLEFRWWRGCHAALRRAIRLQL